MHTHCCSRWQQTLVHSFDAIAVLDAQGCVTGWNERAEQCFGWLQHEVLARPLTESILLPDSAQAFVQELKALLHNGRTVPGRRVLVGMQAQHRTGHAIPLEISLTYAGAEGPPEVLAFIRNVSERQDAEKALRIAAATFQSLEGMVLMDAEGTILKVNQAFTDITGYSEQEAVGRQSALFYGCHRDEAFYQALHRDLPSKHGWQGEVWDIRKNAERYPAWLRVTEVLDSAGAVSHYVAAFWDLSAQQASAQRLHYLDFHDPLTQLPNRRLALERLHQALAAGGRKNERCAVLLLDVDGFNAINDTLGQRAGDKLLLQLGRRLRNSLHAEDTVARLDSNTFAVLLQGLHSAQAHATARTVAERLLHALRVPFELAPHTVHMTASVGLAVSADTSTTAQNMLQEADIAMHRAKQDGGNCMRLFDPAQQALLEHRFEILTALRSDFPCHFAVHYQLLVDAQQAAFGVEALARWTHPTLGPIAPSEFIPLAEEAGMVHTVGGWVLQQACMQLTTWGGSAHTRHLRMAVNVSARQFHDDGFVATVLDALEHSGANPHLLTLELTEGVVLQGVDAVVKKMEQLRRVGVRFALDDFGTGYSSLAYLQQLPVDQLKIDKTFVQRMAHDGSSRNLVRAMVAMSQALGLQVLAEGVETAAQLALLQALGCNAYQGYHFYKPMAAAAVAARLLPQPAAAHPIPDLEREL